MASAKGVVDKLIVCGIIPKDCKDVATIELHRELERRSKRIAQTLATMVSLHQFAIKIAEEETFGQCLTHLTNLS